ncbi:uncharacterized protein LOC128552785 isoform X2 [Mercenaria mercenaria]|nr:uncharacterized protein LOC128552785 isoform X2 [Mercenaria mercenaria]
MSVVRLKQTNTVEEMKLDTEETPHPPQLLPPGTTDGSETDLDWNSLFAHFVTILPSRNYKLFFINLFSCTQHCQIDGRSSEDIIDAIEIQHKYDATESKLYELLRAWRDSAGAEAKVAHIENTLHLMGQKLCLEKLQTYMRDPPKLRKPCYSSTFAYPHRIIPFTSTVALPHSSSTVCDPHVGLRFMPRSSLFELHDHRMQPCHNTQSYPYQNQNSITGDIRQLHTLENMPLNSCLTKPAIMPAVSTILSYESEKRTQDRRTDSSSSSDESTMLHRVSPKKRFKPTKMYPEHCRRLVPWTKLNTDGIIDLLKTCFPLKWYTPTMEHYYLFLCHTVSCTMDAAQKSEKQVLSLEYNDYREAHVHKTKRGNMTIVVDTIHGCINLNQEQWDCLKLYTDHAREKIYKSSLIERSKYVFIKFDGQPVIQEIEEKSASLTSGEGIAEKPIHSNNPDIDTESAEAFQVTPERCAMDEKGRVSPDTEDKSDSITSEAPEHKELLRERNAECRTVGFTDTQIHSANADINTEAAETFLKTQESSAGSSAKE